MIRKIWRSIARKLLEMMGVDLNPPKPVQKPAPEDLCCNGIVHITFRGLADGRRYMSRNRAWRDVRYFQKNHLHVFCVDCRRLLYSAHEHIDYLDQN